MWRAWDTVSAMVPFKMAFFVAFSLLTVMSCHQPPASETEPPDPKPDVVAPRTVPSGPFLRVLGTAQDGGVPHASCNHEWCRRARTDPRLRRHVASLALVVPSSGLDAEDEARNSIYLVDVSPDIREQLPLLQDLQRAPADRVERAPVNGAMLTHAHIGHYLGLAFFGFEAVHTEGLVVDCTPRMAGFLRDNGPWSQLVSLGNIVPRERPPGEVFALDGVEVVPLAVPHRDELSDTVGYIFRGPTRTALYVPDTDAWAKWPVPLETILDREGITLAIVDATFYGLDELPGRDISQVPHPLITTSMDLLQARVDAGTLGVYFTHLNHSNPALDPESEARQTIERRGFHVLEDGQDLAL